MCASRKRPAPPRPAAAAPPPDAAERVRLIFERRFSVYTDTVVHAALRDLARLEREILHSTLASRKPSDRKLTLAFNHILSIRSLEKSIKLRQMVVDRLTLDGPGEWLQSAI